MYLVLAAGDLVGAGQKEDGAEAHEPEGGEHQQDERALPRPGILSIILIMFAWNIVGSLILAPSRYDLLYLKSILAMMEVSCDHRLGCWQSAATAQVFFHPCDTILHFTIESPFFGDQTLGSLWRRERPSNGLNAIWQFSRNR